MKQRTISSIVSNPFFKKKYILCVGLSANCVCLCVFSVWVFRCGSGVCQCVDPNTGLKSLIKGWQIFLASCVVLRQTAGLLFSLPPLFFIFFFLSPSLPPHPPSLSSLITEGAAGGLCSSPALCVDVLHSCCTMKNPRFLIGGIGS